MRVVGYVVPTPPPLLPALSLISSTEWFGSDNSAPSCQIWMPHGLMLPALRIDAGLSERWLTMFISPCGFRWKRTPTITVLSASTSGRPLNLATSSGPRYRPPAARFRRCSNSWSLSGSCLRARARTSTFASTCALGTRENACSIVPFAGMVTSARLPANPGASPTIVTLPVGSPSRRNWPVESTATERSSWGTRTLAPRIGTPAVSTILPVSVAEPCAAAMPGSASPRNAGRTRRARARRTVDPIIRLPLSGEVNTRGRSDPGENPQPIKHQTGPGCSAVTRAPGQMSIYGVDHGRVEGASTLVTSCAERDFPSNGQRPLPSAIDRQRGEARAPRVDHRGGGDGTLSVRGAWGRSAVPAPSWLPPPARRVFAVDSAWIPNEPDSARQNSGRLPSTTAA